MKSKGARLEFAVCDKIEPGPFSPSGDCPYRADALRPANVAFHFS